MPRYYVDIPGADGGYGAVSHCHAVIDDSPTREEAAQNAWPAAFPDSLPNIAIEIPNEMTDWPKRRILDHYSELQERLGDDKFYRTIMKTRNPCRLTLRERYNGLKPKIKRILRHI